MNACTYGIGFNNNMYNGYYDPTTLFNGSIFGNYCNPDWDGMCGYELTKFFASAATGAIGTAISNSKENSVENHEAAVEEIQERIDAKLESLDVKTEAEALAYDVKTKEPKYQEDITKATKDIENANKQIESLNTSISNHKTSVETLKKQLETAPDEEKSELQTKLDKAETELKKATDEKEKLEKSIKDDGELKKALKTAEGALEARIKVVDDIKEEIKELQDIRNKKQKELEARIFDKADGASSLFRNKDLKTENLTQGTVNFDSADIRELCSRFPKLPEGSYEKYDCARAFAQLDNTVFQRLATPTQIRAREIATEYYEKHKTNPPKKVESTEATT